MKYNQAAFNGALAGIAITVILHGFCISELEHNQQALISELELLETRLQVRIQELDDRSHTRELELKNKIELASPHSFPDRRK